jgi:fructosamine-3-kinase
VAPLPEVVREAPGELVMTELPGDTWFSLRARLSPAARAALRGELGGVVAALHRVTGDGFGYPQDGAAPTWREAFTSMISTILGDADRFGVPLPDVGAAVAANAHLLDEVTTPALVHFDLWDGNILVSGGHVTGIIDAERAFWGDPLADMASLALFGDIEADAAFVAGYREAGGVLDFTDSSRRRIALYQCYLYTIMLVEQAPRQQPAPPLTSGCLSDALAVLER